MKVERIIIVILIFLVFLAIGIGLYAIFRPTFVITTPSPSPTMVPEVVSPTIVPELDGSALPSPSPTPESGEVVSDEVMIKAAMAQKHGKGVEEVNLSVGDMSGIYASGVVSFAGEIGGGWWLAVKSGDEWIIVADGNGTVMCNDIDPYNFPISMVPECWDDATQTLITR
ncbi:hypothetical protein ACFL0F_00765 [Patescibacteria group bacterium]